MFIRYEKTYMPEEFKSIDWGDFYNPRSKEIITKRLFLAKYGSESREFRDLVMAKCKEDPVFWIDNFVWTSDPRNLDIGKPTLTPFQCFQKQKEYIQWRRKCRSMKVSGYLLKSRDSGASWLNVADQTHCLLFEKGFKGGMASRKEKFVDEIGNLDSLFEKIRFILKYLPSWMRPGKGEILDNYCKIINLTNDSSIVGESGDEIGRGGRLTVEDVDEGAYIPRAKKVARSLSQTTNTVFWTSTPNGKDNHYGESYLSGKNETFFISWKDDPRKNDGWYEKMCKTLDPLTIAREIDASFEDSSDDTLFKYRILKVSENAFRKRFPSPLITAGLDVATGGKNKSIYTLLEAGCQARKQVEIDLVDTSEIAFAAHNMSVRSNVDVLTVDVVAVGEGVVSTLMGIPNRPYRLIPFRGNLKPTNYYWSTHDCYSTDRFVNLRADIAHQVKEKIDKTYQHKMGIRSHDHVEMLSFNSIDTNKLFSEMEMITDIKRPDGKIKLPSKADLRANGIESPDRFDSLCLAYAGVVMNKNYNFY
jgi:hypothetical protein